MLQQLGKIESIGPATKFNCVQSKFAINTSNCWFASALGSYANNVSKKPITLDFQLDVEKKAYNLPRPMPVGALTGPAGINIISEILGTNKDLFGRHSIKFYNYLKKGYVITITIDVTDTFIQQWKSGGVIKGGKGKRIGGHVLCLFMDNGKYYLLNSRDEANPVRELESLYLYNVFMKATDCGVILP